MTHATEAPAELPSTTSPLAAVHTPYPGVMATLRSTFRLSLVALHIVAGLLTLRCIFPFINEAAKKRTKQRWSRNLLRVLGVRMEMWNEDLPSCAVVVCNHISWLDIFVLNARVQTLFVCKQEVRSWPAIGWLVAASGTIFIDRTSRAGAAQALQILSDSLRKDERVAFYPEGTTTNGTFMLPFSTALFEAATLGGAHVVPMSLRYLNKQGHTSLAPAYDGDISFVECITAITREPWTQVCLQRLDTLPPGLSRREYAAQCERMIADNLQLQVVRGAGGAAA
ncbi:lysophospholipid acyltransferase family protein [Viridibacterium curvum]|uniref:Lysophospholipid acyltransferase family protein n=2 Tax=Viridibacterium curvum TaxID=1101404 RepID=A0ABP9R7C4_9RHOO